MQTYNIDAGAPITESEAAALFETTALADAIAGLADAVNHSLTA